jgi:DNA-binding NarL/FixJ family response regulator
MTENANNSDKTAVGVLICDDNETFRDLLREVVQSRPSSRVVGEAADGNEAIVEAARLQPDVILLDLAMPLRTGLDSILELGRVAPGAQIIVFTGFSEASVAQDVLDLGAVRFLSKGASPDAINNAIEEVAAETGSGAVVTPHRAPRLATRRLSCF